MSRIVNGITVDLKKWEADKKRIIVLQDSIECQERTRTETNKRIQELENVVNGRILELKEEKKRFLSQHNSLVQDIENLKYRMDHIDSIYDMAAQQNIEVGKQINRLIADIGGGSEKGRKMFVEARAQFVLMKFNTDFIKFANRDIIALDTRIKAGENTDWTASTMLSEAEELLSRVYLMNIEVSEAKKKYIEEQRKCMDLATAILERAKEIRDKVNIDNYKIGEKIDYWTRNSLEIIENKVNNIVEMIKDKRNDPDFQIDDLRELFQQLYILNQDKDAVLNHALDNYRHSRIVQSEVNRAGVLIIRRHGFKCVGSNYEMKDDRRPFIARFQRSSDGMEVEFLCMYNQTKKQYEFVHRMNTTAYMDPNIRATIVQGIAQTLTQVGVRIEGQTQCSPEQTLEPFNAQCPVITQATMQTHDISVVPLG